MNKPVRITHIAKRVFENSAAHWHQPIQAQEITPLPKLGSDRFAALALLLILALFLGALSFSQTARDLLIPKAHAESQRYVTLTQGKAKIVKTDNTIADILVANPSVIDARAIRSDSLSITGLTLGETNILLMDGEGNLKETINISVSIDEQSLTHAIKTLFPNENVKAKIINDDVVLTGNVSSAATASAIRDIALRFTQGEEGIVNMMQVDGEQQVMIKVRVLEVSRSILNELGIETEYTGSILNGEGTAGLSVTDALGLTIDPSYTVGSFTYNNGGIGPLNMVMRALERDGMVNTLAEPNLTAISGENARFLAGGEYPIPTSRDRDGNIVYEYKPFGVSLSFKPVVLSNDRINLQVLTEVSEVSIDQTLQLPGITIPSFTVRRAETTVELGSGGSLVLAGLIESQAIRSMNEVPGVNKVPIIGDLISSESFQRNESELIVMMTAYTVEPFAQNDNTIDLRQNKNDVPEDMQALSNAPINTHLQRRLVQALRQTGGAEATKHHIDNVRYIIE